MNATVKIKERSSIRPCAAAPLRGTTIKRPRTKKHPVRRACQLNDNLTAFRLETNKESTNLHGPQGDCELVIAGIEGEALFKWLPVFINFSKHLTTGEVMFLPIKLLGVHFFNA